MRLRVATNSWITLAAGVRWRQRPCMFLLIAIAAFVSSSDLAAAEEPAADLEFFESRIRPVLVQRCYECHSAQAKTANLARSLLSLALQTAPELLAEIVVADDGSRDHTWDVVDGFARQTRLPVAFSTHEHGEFQPGRSRNEAAQCSTAPYLAFLDGDCVVQPNFLATHAARRRPGVALCGESLRLERPASQAVTDEVVRSSSLIRLVEPEKLRRYRLKTWRDRAYSYFRVPMRPHLTSNHFSLWRTDFERVDGFDLGFRGWGLEDHDLQRRLLLAGMRCRTVLPHTVGFHLWHSPVPSFVRDAKNTPNEEYYRQPPHPDGRARSGLSDVDLRACSVFRWRRGELVEANVARAA